LISTCPSGSEAVNGSCKRCAAGSFNPTSNSICSSCTEGTFSDSYGFSICSQCTAGTFQSQQGQTYCSNCTEGKLSIAAGQAACSDCPASKWSSPGSSTCSLCAAGYYLASNNICTLCPSGRFSSAGGQTYCPSCGPGTYTFNGTCIDCPIGKFNPLPLQTFCGDCGPGMVNLKGAQASSSDCSGCDAGTYSESSSSAECTKCEFGKWSISVNASTLSTCLLCPVYSNVVCAEGSVVPYVGEGLFRTLDSPAKILICSPPESCDAAEFGNTTCASAYTGLGCVSCASNYFRSGGKCVLCLKKFVRWTIIVLVAAAILLILMKFADQQQRIPGSLRLVLFWYQFLSLFTNFSSSWPPVLSGFLNFSNLFNFDVGYMGLGCDIPGSYLSVLTVKILFPLIFGTALIMQYFFLWITKRIRLPLLNLFSNFVFIANFFSVQLLSSLLQVFNCTFTGEQLVMSQDPSIVCGSEVWKRFVAFDVVFFILYVIVVPASVYHLLRKSSQQVMQAFGFMTRPYIAGKEWFEYAKFLFRLGFVLLRDVLRITDVAKIVFLELWLLIFLWITYNFRPYAETSSQNVSLL
jgi:hypothetical protein